MWTRSDPEAKTGLKKHLLTAGAITAGAVILGVAADRAITLNRKYNFTEDQREAFTQPSTILEYYAAVVDSAEELGLDLYAAGGLVKQALGDESTIIDPHTRTITISDDSNCETRRKATVLRPREWTLRDLDFRLKRIRPRENATNAWIIAGPDQIEEIKNRTARLQELIDSHAKQSHGLDQGPEISMFGYEDDFRSTFKPSDYATRTKTSADQKSEIIFDNNGHSFELAESEPWTCIINTPDRRTLRIPTDSPETILGRTLTRTTVMRARDADDVARIISSLEQRGLWDALRTERWDTYVSFRHQLDKMTSTQDIARSALSGNVKLATSLSIVKVLSPLLRGIENSSLGAEFRRRGGPLAKFANSAMGAVSTDNIKRDT